MTAKQIFFYRSEGALRRIDLGDVVFLESADNYVKFNSTNEVHIVRTSLEIALSQLPEDQFIQIHRSYAITVDQIQGIGRDFVSIKAYPDKALPMSKKFFAALMEKAQI